MSKVSGTKEWAKHNLNIMKGCQHDCKYCYAKNMAVRFKRSTPESWSTPVLNEKVYQKTVVKKDGRIMYPTTHDIHPDDLHLHINFLSRQLFHGNEFLIVSKPHIECVKAMCEKFQDYKDKILFRFTIGSRHDFILKYWEPGAPSFEERLESLKFAHDSGFNTSVSCEPMLDDEIEKLVPLLMPFVTDSIWIGKANKLKSRCRSAVGGLYEGKLNSSIMTQVNRLEGMQNDIRIKEIYENLKDNSKVKWKESIKEVIPELEVLTESGLDK